MFKRYEEKHSNYYYCTKLQLRYTIVLSIAEIRCLLLFFWFAAKSPEGKAPEVIKPAKKVEVEEGKPAKIECQISGQPKPTVEWFKDSENVKETKRIKPESDDKTFSLNFKETELDDEGDYKCVARNEFGSVSSQAELLVNEVGAKPEFKEKLKNVSVQSGNKARFDVLVTGSPPPEVDWLKGDDKLEDAGRFSLLDNEEEGIFSLIIEDVKPEDGGKYECIAFNELGEVSCKANLAVEETLVAPEFAEEAESAPILVEEGGDIDLNVLLKKGQPEPQVEWLKDDKPVEVDERLDVGIKEDTHSLKIKGAVPSDSGLYKFKVSSKAGSLERVFDVQIAGTVFHLILAALVAITLVCLPLSFCAMS